MSGEQKTAIGKYQIIREIARSNDIVYEAYDPVMNRRVALKELAMPSGTTDAQHAERIKRFVREAKAAGSLNHPNIVTIYECGEDAGRHFIAMEFLEGHTLRNELDTHGFLSPARALEIAKDVLVALEYAHQNGVIHRDIKPENIQLLPDGRIKLTDFGIARLTFEPNLTMDGQVFGTPSYMSPEQVVGKEIDARSDLFGLGVVLYEAICGQKPFTGDSVVSITYSIMNTTPAQPQQANHTVWQVISRALEKSPQLRHSSASAMRTAIEEAQQTLHSVVLPAGPTLSSSMASQPPSAPPVGNPYLSTSHAPPPIVYPYDPYQQPPTYGPGGSFPGGGMPQLPVYYPPPPRPPFVSAETKAFFGRLLVTVLILGTIFALVIAVVYGLGTAWMRDKAQYEDRSIRQGLGAQDASEPLDVRIKKREDAIGKLKDDVSIREERQSLADLYAERGRRSLAAGRLVEASADLEAAAQRDPTNSKVHADLAELYYALARNEMDSDRRKRLWEQAATSFAAAMESAPTSELRAKYGEEAATIFVNLASELMVSGNPFEARQRLYDARSCAPPGSQIASAVENMIRRLTE